MPAGIISLRSRDHFLVLANENHGFHGGYNLCIWVTMDKVISFADQANGVHLSRIAQLT